MKKLNVLFAASEAAPFVKVGGLGDVAGSLPRALSRLEHAPDIRMVLPLHQSIDREKYSLKPVAVFTIAHAYQQIQAEVFETEFAGVPVYFIAGEPIGEAVYSSDEYLDGLKYIFFSLALLELPRVLKWHPDILHVNDWHTAAAIYSLSLHRGRDPYLKDTASLLTIHNLPYLGVGTEKALEEFGVPPAYNSDLPDWAKQMPLPLGLHAADKINLVSPGYAEEVLTPEFGSGLDGYLETQTQKLTGIINGLDLENWNPEQDQELVQNFNRASLGKRNKNKKHLLTTLDFSDEIETPLIGIISRMDYQKGIDVAVEALTELGEKRDWRAVILGTGSPEIEDQARALARRFPQRVRTLIRFDAILARRIYAGADMILIPSRYEPCGLTQMIGMRYGCVPVARAVGGLKDTIEDYNPRNGQGTGFLYQENNLQELVYALEGALDVYRDQRHWLGIQQAGMKQDFSWRRSAVQYLALYHDLINARIKKL